MRQTRTFLVRLLVDDADPTQLRGQLSEPGSDDEWHHRFADVDEFLNGLRQRLTPALLSDLIKFDHVDHETNS